MIFFVSSKYRQPLAKWVPSHFSPRLAIFFSLGKENNAPARKAVGKAAGLSLTQEKTLAGLSFVTSF